MQKAESFSITEKWERILMHSKYIFHEGRLWLEWYHRAFLFIRWNLFCKQGWRLQLSFPIFLRKSLTSLSLIYKNCSIHFAALFKQCRTKPIFLMNISFAVSARNFVQQKIYKIELKISKQQNYFCWFLM